MKIRFNLLRYTSFVLGFILIGSIGDFIIFHKTSFFEYIMINLYEGGIFGLGLICGYFLMGSKLKGGNEK